MKLRLKAKDVNLDGLDESMVLALFWCMSVWKQHGMQEIMITSANDGKHIENSLHYQGKALDIRVRNVPDKQGMADDIRGILPNVYDVLLYETHLHIEFDTKRKQ